MQGTHGDYYWQLGEDGRLTTDVMRVSDRIVMAPEKLDAIRTRWKQAGITVEIEYRNREGPKELHNCYLDWAAPKDHGFLFGNVVVGRGTTKLALMDQGDIPLRDIICIEVFRNGSLAVTKRGGEELLLDRARGEYGRGSFLPLVPAIVGYYYEPTGAYTTGAREDKVKSYFTEYAFSFSDIRKMIVRAVDTPRPTQPNGSLRQGK